MEQEKITNGNKLIANFLKWIIAGTYGDDGCVYEIPEDHPTHAGDVDQDNLMFHYSWDWLVFAWFKFQNTINEMDSPNNNYIFGAQSRFFIGIESQEISISWQSLVEGIEWYNQNKTK